MTWRQFVSRFSLLMLITLFSASSYAESSAANPKLILQITVDQLLGDLPKRYYERLGEGGFKYLWETGIVYRDAHHAHSNTETIVGHTRHNFFRRTAQRFGWPVQGHQCFSQGPGSNLHGRTCRNSVLVLQDKR